MSTELSKSEIFALLAKRRRRLLLRLLRDTSTPPTMIGVAKHIQRGEYEDSLTRDLKAIRLSLYHTHIPKLEEADVVEYNENHGTVRPGRNYEALIQFLEKVGEDELTCPDQ